MSHPDFPRPARARRALEAACALCLLLLAHAAAFAQEGGAASADPLLLKAEEEIARGDLGAAAVTLEAAVADAPTRIEPRLRLAGLEKKRAMWLRAAEQYRAILELDPAHIAGRLGYAELLLSDYQFKGAEGQFRLLLKQELPHHDLDRAQIGLGTTLYALGRYQEAIEAFALVLERHPDDPTAGAYTNFALRKSGDLDGAIRGWTRLVEKRADFIRGQLIAAELQELRADIVRQRGEAAARPGEPGVHRLLGDLLMEKPDLPGAIAAYSRAAELDPRDVGLRFRLGVALRESGHIQAAADAFRSLSRDTDLGGLASYNLAWCERRLAGPAAEATAWERAVEHNPRDAYAYTRYVDALLRSGGLEREVGLLLPAIKERPLDPLPRLQFGVLSLEAGQPEEAARALLDALSIEPNEPWGQIELKLALRASPGLASTILEEIRKSELSGREDPRVNLHRKAALHLAAGHPDECVAFLRPVVATDPTDARAAVALAGCQRAAGASPADLVALLAAARDAVPAYVHARLDLAMALAAGGRFREAAREAQAAIELSPTEVRALVALAVSLRELGDRGNLLGADAALARALEAAPMDPTGVARLLRAKVAWQLGREEEARRLLKGDLPVEPEELYRMSWKFVRDHYGDRTFNGQNWDVWEDRFEGTLETETDALGAIALMLASLADPDTGLRSGDQTAAYMFTERSSQVDRLPTGRAASSSKSVEVVALEENVGYVAVTNMNDPKLSEEVKRAFDQMENRDAVILDLRGNLGGAEREAEAITSMLVEPGTPTGSVVTPQGNVPTVSGGQEPPKIPDKPVIVLVDRNTASSAEALAGALRESKRAVIVGETTYGKAGIQLPHLLPGGATLMLAAAESGDLAGVSYSGRGIEPDVTVDDSAPDADKSKDAAITRARELLRKRRMEKATGSGDTTER